MTALDPATRARLLERLRAFYERELTEGQGAYFSVGADGGLVPTRMGRSTCVFSTDSSRRP